MVTYKIVSVVPTDGTHLTKDPPENLSGASQGPSEVGSIDENWTMVCEILKRVPRVLSEVPLMPCGSGSPIIVPNPTEGVISLRAISIDLDQLSRCGSDDSIEACRNYLKYIIAYLQRDSGLIASDRSLDAILNSYVTDGIMVVLEGRNGAGQSEPMGVSIGSITDQQGICFKAQYSKPALQGWRLSACMDRLVIESLINKYGLGFPLSLRARSTTLAVLAKLPGFLSQLQMLAQFMNAINALWDSERQEICKRLGLLMVDCDPDIREIRGFLEYIIGFGKGEEWRFDIQIELYQLMVQVLNGTDDSLEGLLSAIETLKKNIFERYGLDLNVDTLKQLCRAVHGQHCVISPFRLFALARAIDSHAPHQQRPFSQDDVQGILDKYRQLSCPGETSQSDGTHDFRTSPEFSAQDIEGMSQFFVQLQQLYVQFGLSDIKYKLGMDLLVLFAGRKRDYGRVWQWNTQLLMEQGLFYLSTMPRSVAADTLARILPGISGDLTPEFLSQLLLSAIQTGAYFEVVVPIDSRYILDRYFDSKQLSKDFLDQSDDYYRMQTALELALLHYLELSASGRSDASKNRATMTFSLQFKQTISKMRLEEKKEPSSDSPWCWRTKGDSSPQALPVDLGLKEVDVNGHPVVVSLASDWQSGWRSGFHVLFGVDPAGQPRFIDPDLVICQCMDAVNMLNSEEGGDLSRGQKEAYKQYMECLEAFLKDNNIIGPANLQETEDNIPYFKDSDLKIPLDVLASLFFLHMFRNEETPRGLCIFEGNTYRMLWPPGHQPDPDTACYIAVDQESGSYARYQLVGIQSDLSRGFPSEDWRTFAQKKVHRALAQYLKHRHGFEYQDKHQALKRDLSDIAARLRVSSPNNLDDFDEIIGGGIVRAILRLAVLISCESPPSQ